MERIIGKRTEVFCECLAAIIAGGCWLLLVHAIASRMAMLIGR
ncbi:MAG: hypothetical protein U1A28_05230 [Patescibacteria group bacterium]|nr:hypothetical protein [Patescibacteria group bacterium]